VTTALHNLSQNELIELIEQRDALLQQQHAAHQREFEVKNSSIPQFETRVSDYETRVSDYETRLSDYETRLSDYAARVFDLEFQIKELRRLLHGAKRERFIAEMSDTQLMLRFDPTDTEVTAAVEAELETIRYERKKPQQKKHEGRMELPKHLPVVETVLEPLEDTTGMQRIGEEITDELDITPARMHINRTKRPKYATPLLEDGSQRIVIAPMPQRPIDKCLASADLLTTITIDKHVHHMPIDRQLKRYMMLGVDIPTSTVESWQRLTAELFRPLHAALRSEVLQACYLQVDETGLAVQDNAKQGTTHKGFLWGYHAPWQRIVYFDYQKGRGQIHFRELLDNYRGYLQTDDYQAYHHHKARDGVIGLACWAHTQRNFEKALDYDRDRAGIAMKLIQKIYEVEREARDNNLTHERRKELRLEKSLPVLNIISAWMVDQLPEVLPKSPLGKALRYAIRLWDELMAYLYDGRLEIDNNLMENAIRPIALGRKNWLFAGSHEAAQNIAMYRSFFATCHLNEINPYNWTRYVLMNINTTAPVNYQKLLPHRIDLSLLS
jgi:transposase